MISIAENQLKINIPLSQAWRFELGCIFGTIDTFPTFSQAVYEFNSLQRSNSPDGLYIWDRFAPSGRPEVWAVGRSGMGIECISRRPL